MMLPFFFFFVLYKSWNPRPLNVDAKQTFRILNVTIYSIRYFMLLISKYLMDNINEFVGEGVKTYGFWMDGGWWQHKNLRWQNKTLTSKYYYYIIHNTQYTEYCIMYYVSTRTHTHKPITINYNSELMRTLCASVRFSRGV